MRKRMDARKLFAGRLVLLGLVQEAFDAAGYLLRAVQEKMDFRAAAHLNAFDEFMAKEARGGIKPFHRRSPLRFVAVHADVDARLLHVRRNTDLGHGHHSGETRILQLARQHGAHFVMNLFRHAFVAMSGNGHGFTQSTSTWCAIKSRPSSRSDSANTDCSDSSRCFSSAERVTTPTTERCQVS